MNPTLLINRGYIAKLNEAIICVGGKPAKPKVFRGNFVIRKKTMLRKAYAEDL